MNTLMNKCKLNQKPVPIRHDLLQGNTERCRHGHDLLESQADNKHLYKQNTSGCRASQCLDIRLNKTETEQTWVLSCPLEVVAFASLDDYTALLTALITLIILCRVSYINCVVHCSFNKLIYCFKKHLNKPPQQYVFISSLATPTPQLLSFDDLHSLSHTHTHTHTLAFPFCRRIWASQKFSHIYFFQLK